MSETLKIDRAKWYKRLGYVPRNGQREMDLAVADGNRFVGFFAFPRAGKSFGAARHVEPYLLQPDNHGWIVAPTYSLGSKEFGYIWADFVETGLLKRAKYRHFDVRGGNMSIEFPWGSFVKVVSADNPTSLRAEELDWLILAEASALDENIYHRHLYARVEKRNGLVLVPTTPKGHNWVYHTFMVPARQEIAGIANPRYVGKPFWARVVSSVPEYGDILEPGVYTDESIENARKTLPIQLFKEQFGGDFASYAGLVYADYEQPNVVVEPFLIPSWWTHIVGWDSGANDPTAIILGSWSPEGKFYVWGEIYTKGLSTAAYWQMTRGLLNTLAPTAIVRDPSEKQLEIELQQIGVSTTVPYTRQIEARIMRITGLLRTDSLKILRGRAPHLEEQFVSYEWDEDNPGKPRKNQREDTLDALGYALLCQVDLPQSTPGEALTIPGEDPQVTKLWRKVRAEQKRYEERKGQDELGELIGSPLEETGLFVDNYEPYW